MENGRIYLYENFNVFLKHSGIKINDYPDRKMEDVISDAFMFIDWCIQKSIAKWYANTQIYKYIERRLWWRLLNKEPDKEAPWWYLHDINEHIRGVEFDMDSIEKSMQLHIIKENLHGLDQIDKQIILIKYFGDGSVSQKDIAKACWVWVSAIWMRQERAIKQLRKSIFNLKDTEDEETNQSKESNDWTGMNKTP